MQIDELLGNYTMASKEVFLAINSDDVQRVSKADQEISNRFDDLINFTPSTLQESITLVEGLFDILDGLSNESAIFLAVRNKTISIIRRSEL